MKIAICVLAKDEGETIGHLVEGVARQSICADRSIDLAMYLVANGCTDDTVSVFEDKAAGHLTPIGMAWQAFDYPEPGKSRSWNRFVHNPDMAGFEIVLFIDSDIAFLHADVLADGIAALRADPKVKAWSGHPIKDITAKARKGLLDRLSLAASRHTRYVGSINGSLYAVRSSVLASIWMPDETPGEDGFLNAMVATNGFTQQPVPGEIIQSEAPTHYFEAHSVTQFLKHERRMMVGTCINRWIFEYLWSLKLTEPAGYLIARLNAENPHWVADIIASHVRGRAWVIPRAEVLRRLNGTGGRPSLSYLLKLLVLISATVAGLPAAMMANATLKKRGAAAHW